MPSAPSHRLTEALKPHLQLEASRAQGRILHPILTPTGHQEAVTGPHPAPQSLPRPQTQPLGAPALHARVGGAGYRSNSVCAVITYKSC